MTTSRGTTLAKKKRFVVNTIQTNGFVCSKFGEFLHTATNIVYTYSNYEGELRSIKKIKNKKKLYKRT